MNPIYHRDTERSLDFRSDKTFVAIYNKRGDVMGQVPVSFSYANTEGHEFEITDVVYGDLLNEKPEIYDIHEAIQTAMGLHNSLVFVGSFSHDANLI